MAVMVDEDWVEKPVERLNRLEKAYTIGVRDQSDMKRDINDLKKSVENINQTLANMASEELTELRRRADLPKRILFAVLLPVLVGVVIALVSGLLSGAIHLA